jgi:hypothetical protein
MAIAIRAATRRQVYLLSALFVVIVMIASWELLSAFGGSSYATPAPSSRSATATLHDVGSVRDTGLGSLVPRLRSKQLVRSEQVEYASTGRNIFSAESAVVQIEAPTAPARPVPDPSAAISAPVPERPKVPAIDLKYLGYTQSADKKYSALLVHGEDSLIASSGEIIFHRYKIGAILPASVEVTDLRHDNTQAISVTQK